MMYALGDMDGIICLAGALCKTWALLFTGEFVSQHSRSAPCTGLTHVRGGVWVGDAMIGWWHETYPRARGSLALRTEHSGVGNDLPTCAEKFG